MNNTTPEHVSKSLDVDGHTLVVETGLIARQASSFFVSMGGTQILATACCGTTDMLLQGFFPLSVDYIEKFYSAGKFPGGFIKREGRPSEREILISRLIDRSLRPLFPKFHRAREVQVVVSVLSYDPEYSPICLAIFGASCALHCSPIPFLKPVAGVHIVKTHKHPTVYWKEKTAETPDIDIITSGTFDGFCMLEGHGACTPAHLMTESLEKAQPVIQSLCALQENMYTHTNPTSFTYPWETESQKNDGCETLTQKFEERITQGLYTENKKQRQDNFSQLKTEALQDMPEDQHKNTEKKMEELFTHIARKEILEKKTRLDGRGYTDIRPISGQIGLLKRPHGSALFTRGQTQALAVVTLGTEEDGQVLDGPTQEKDIKSFTLHYNMPGYSVGEVKRIGAPGRREIGHGALAERSLIPTLPNTKDFGYTIRVVSEITESNGSSSMASVCASTMALLHAGVPLSEPVAGIAMGLISDPHNGCVILSDISGEEDHFGDMDFKVAGTKKGLTGFQMDVKVPSIPIDWITQAIDQAEKGIDIILSTMLKVIHKPNPLSIHAPRLEHVQIKTEKIRDLIGPSGKNIKKIVSDTGCKIDVQDSGLVVIAATDAICAQKAKKLIHYLITDPQIGDVYIGLVKKVADFGVFVEIKPGMEGLVHASHLSNQKDLDIENMFKEGQDMLVKVIELDRFGRIKLSRKDAFGLNPKDPTRPWL